MIVQESEPIITIGGQAVLRTSQSLPEPAKGAEARQQPIAVESPPTSGRDTCQPGRRLLQAQLPLGLAFTHDPVRLAIGALLLLAALAALALVLRPRLADSAPA